MATNFGIFYRVHTEQKLNIATENEKKLEEELDQLKIKFVNYLYLMHSSIHGHHRYRKLKSDYEKIIRDGKNNYGNDKLGQVARSHRHITCTVYNVRIPCRRHPIPLERMQSMPAVHQGGQNYVVKKKPGKINMPIRQKAQLGSLELPATHKRHQNEIQKCKSHWSTQAVLDFVDSDEEDDELPFY